MKYRERGYKEVILYGIYFKNPKKNVQPNFYIYIKFNCYNCGSTKIVLRSEFQKMTNETFKNTKIFFFERCNTKMIPVSIKVNY